MFGLHEETGAALDAPVDTAFACLDDFRKLSSHMEKSSAMMLGSRMTIETDTAHGRAIGSKVRMRGRVRGFALVLDDYDLPATPPARWCVERMASDAVRTLGAARG